MGLVGGQRAMTPLAVVAVSAWRNELARDNGAPRLLSHPLAAAGAAALAVAEMASDKQKSAPDRVILPGLIARFVTSAIAGAALATRQQRWAAAEAEGTTALVASYVGWHARCTAMETYGQTPTGFVEDAAVLGSAVAVMRS